MVDANLILCRDEKLVQLIPCTAGLFSMYSFRIVSQAAWLSYRPYISKQLFIMNTLISNAALGVNCCKYNFRKNI